MVRSLFFCCIFLICFSLPKINAQPYAPIDSIVACMQMENIDYSFLHMNRYFRSKPLMKSDAPFIFPRAESSLPQAFQFRGESIKSLDFLDKSYTQGLLVIQDGVITYENYWLGQSETTPHISWSVSKSFISTLIGIAIEEGYIKSVKEKVDDYLPELKGSGYEGVLIKEVLEMATGVGFDETYSDPNSDISRWWMSFAMGEPQDAFAATLKREREPGTYNEYVSLNTHVLGMLLTEATGKSITDYMQEKLWTPLGMEYDGYWLSDKTGMEMALGGLNASLRDYAKLGQLFLQKGKWQGQQLVPQKWVKNSTTPLAEYGKPDSENSASAGIGYAYQWWIPDGKVGEYLAVGVFNQYIYINPSTNTVIVKNSANRNYYDGSDPYRSSTMHLELFRKIAEQSK